MDSTIRLFLLFCFAVFFFAGCNRKGSQAEVNGPKGGATADQKKQGKVVPKETAEQIALSIAILDEMGKIYQEIVPKAAGINVTDGPAAGDPTITGAEVSASANVFQILSSMIQYEYTAEGQGQIEPAKAKEKLKVAAAASSAKNSLRDSNIKNNNASCTTVGLPHLNPTRRKEDDPKSTVFTLNFNLCQDSKASLPLATWQRDANGDWQFVFSVKALNHDGINAYGRTGASLEALGSGCAVRYDEKEKRIELMDCRVLSTDVKGANEVNPSKALYLSKIDFNRQREVQLKMAGSLVDYSVYPAKHTQLVVTDVPKLNTIHVKALVQAEPKKIENEKGPSDEGSAGTASPEAATSQVPASAAGDSPKSKSQSGAQDLQTQQAGSQESQAQPSGAPQDGQSQSQPGEQQNFPHQQGEPQPNENQTQPQTANPPPEAVT